MRVRLVLLGCLALFGLARAAQAGLPGSSSYITPATQLPLGAFAREEALTVHPAHVSVRRTAPTIAAYVDPTLSTRLPFTAGRTRPLYSDPDSTVRPRGVAGPKINPPASSTFVTVAR